jgi:hypothetical protein
MFGHAAQVSTIYHNPEFGIDLRVPREGLLCSNRKSEHDHGFVILLGGADAQGCSDDSHHRSVVLFAFGNVLDETKHLDGLLRMGCKSAGGRCEPGPGGLGIPGLASATGRVKHNGGWIDLIVATQAGRPSTLDPNEPSTNYVFYLHTHTDHLAEDVKVFREILQTVKLPSATIR